MEIITNGEELVGLNVALRHLEKETWYGKLVAITEVGVVFHMIDDDEDEDEIELLKSYWIPKSSILFIRPATDEELEEIKFPKGVN